MSRTHALILLGGLGPVFMLAACEGSSPVQPLELEVRQEVLHSQELLGDPQALPCDGCVIAQIHVDQSGGQPVSGSTAFEGNSGISALLAVDSDESTRGSLAIRLNGRPIGIFGALNMKGRILLPVALEAENTLEVRISGRPGSSAVVSVLAGAAVVGPDGGEVTSLSGQVTIQIPPGALEGEEILAVEETDHIQHDPAFVQFLGPLVKLSPSGIEFRETVELRFRHPDVRLPDGPPTAVRVLEDRGLLAWIESRIDLDASKIIVGLQSFSSYAFLTPLYAKLRSGTHTISSPTCPRVLLDDAPCRALQLSDLATLTQHWNVYTEPLGVRLVHREADPNASIVVKYFTDMYGFYYLFNDLPIGAALWDVFRSQRVIALNANLTWMPHWHSGRRYGGDGPHPSMDNPVSWSRIVSHELGHHFGLGHRSSSGATMGWSHNLPLALSCEEVNDLVDSYGRAYEDLPFGCAASITVEPSRITSWSQSRHLLTVQIRDDRGQILPHAPATVYDESNVFVDQYRVGWTQNGTVGWAQFRSLDSGTGTINVVQPGIANRSVAWATVDIRPVSSAAGPYILSPLEDEVFDYGFPRLFETQWTSLSGATYYEYDQEWCSVSSSPRRCFFGSWGTTSDARVSTYFIGAQPGRIRVRGILSDGTPTQWSPWRNFRFTL